jgi:nitroreductase
VPDDGLLATLLTQRACRTFAADPVPDEIIGRMLEAATHAPSSENLQPWVFVVVRDAAVREQLATIARRLWDEAGRDHARRLLTPRLFAEVDQSVSTGFGGAPVVIVVGGDVATAGGRRALPSSIYPAVQNLLLAAAALGYGSALTTLASHAPDEVRAAVDLPDTVEPMAIVPVGRPARRLGPPRREPVAAKAHLDRYGVPFGAGDHASKELPLSVGPKVRLRVGPSSIQGLGVFAEQHIAPGHVIEVCPTIHIAPGEEDAARDTVLREYLYPWPPDGGAIVVLGYGSIYNHAVEANAHHVQIAAPDFGVGVHVVAAARAIAPGEEITVNYAGVVGSPESMWFDEDA